jgi:hypothetical protein
MLSHPLYERRQTPRHRLERLATMLPMDGSPPGYCLVLDFSVGGVRINSNGLKIPDEFVLRFSGDGPQEDGAYKVIWRNDPFVGAKLVSGSSATV